MNKQLTTFPKGFYWGTSTSAHQIEGGLHNDWTEWEKSPSRLAYLKKQGLESSEYISGLAVNSWEHLEADIACMKEINSNAYRFSIDWARVEPEEGKFNEAAIKKYHDFILRLQAEGIEPFVTLWHWPIPLWLRDQGGWTNKKIVDYFNRYTKKIVESFPEVKFWLTLNEPTIYAGKSYMEGSWPPQKKNFFLYTRVLNNLIAAHKTSYTTIKKIKPDAQVGIVTNNMDFDPAPGIINKLLASTINWWWNNRILNKICHHQDMIGLNFYFHTQINYGFFNNTDPKISDIGWGLYPPSIKKVLLNLKKYNKPVYITESGLADSTDTYRAWYIQEILRYVLQAIEEGVDVRGYFYWSLLDNFEWSEGFTKKFGLFTVDRTTWQRSARPSASVYATIAKDNKLIT